jgi:2-oxoglutarate ferredoxin oxidoreductase subunit alpha
MVDLMFESFELAERYRTPVLLLSDGVMGQMMEPVRLPQETSDQSPRSWATDGCKGRQRRVIKTLYLDPQESESHNLHLQAKYEQLRTRETRSESYRLGDAEVLIIAFGICARVGRTAVENLREKGLRAGLFRPITLWPFPSVSLATAAAGVRQLLTVELNAGQMVEDVRLALPGREVHFYGRMGGAVISALEIEAEVQRILTEEPK